MMDFLKQYPSVSKEEYMWEWTIPQIRLATYDNTHIRHVGKKEREMRGAERIDDAASLIESFGFDVNNFGIIKR